MWQKIFSVALAISMVALIGCAAQNQKDCCLCDSFRYHAPCLVDLETGKMVELDLYFPHETKTAELAEDQPTMDTFSFVHLGNVSGTKMTANAIIEINVPNADKTTNPALCETCKTLLNGYKGRYVLADLYATNKKTLIPIVDSTEQTIRCYEITMRQNTEEDVVVVIVQGFLTQ